MAELVLTKRAQFDLTTLPKVIQIAVVESLTVIEMDPETAGKALRGRLQGLWSCRVGNYRILYTIERRRVVVRAIRHRGAAYPKRRRR